MISFNIKLAGIVIKVNALYPSTKAFFNDYLSEDKEVFEISVDKEDILYERKKSDDDYKYKDEYLETLAVYRKITEEIINYDILLFHGSVIVKDNKAYMFTAPSGTGKTTHSLLWLKNIEGSYILNGDKPLIGIKDEAITVYGTPYQGKENMGINGTGDLKAIVFIVRDRENHLEKISYKQAFTELYKQTYEFKDKSKALKELSLLNKLGNKITFYRMYCNKEDEAALVAYKGLK